MAYDKGRMARTSKAGDWLHARSSALLVLLSLLLPFAEPAFAASFNTAIKACCRNHGKHECMGRMPEQVGSNNSDRSHASASQLYLAEKCCCPVATAPSSHSAPLLSLAPEASSPSGYAELAVCALAQQGQLSLSPANPKRGPPFSSFLA